MSTPAGDRPAPPEPPRALQALFAQPIRRAVPLDPGYSGHASDVWLVRTDTEEAVARSHRGDMAGPFFWGCRHLFGIDPRRVSVLEPLHALLRAAGGAPVPRVLRQAQVDGRQWAVLERMPGTPLGSLADAPSRLLAELGYAMGRVHRAGHDRFGAPALGPTFPLSAYPTRMAATLEALAARCRPADQPTQRWLRRVLPQARSQAAPGTAALVMMDLDGTQFLEHAGHLAAVVDTEAYVLAPPELELAALEQMLHPAGAAAFASGYTQVQPPPRLGSVRLACRLLLFLLEVQGEDDCDRWMARPPLFP